MSQISTADRTWTGHTDTRVCVPAPPLQISTADTRCLFTGNSTTGRRSRSFVPSRHVGKSARRTTTGTADTRCLFTGTVHRGRGVHVHLCPLRSRHVGKSARRTTTGPVETHRGGRRLTRDRAYLVSVFLVLRFLVHTRSSRVVRGILTEVGRHALINITELIYICDARSAAASGVL